MQWQPTSEQLQQLHQWQEQQKHLQQLQEQQQQQHQGRGVSQGDRGGRGAMYRGRGRHQATYQGPPHGMQGQEHRQHHSANSRGRGGANRLIQAQTGQHNPRGEQRGQAMLQSMQGMAQHYQVQDEQGPGVAVKQLDYSPPPSALSLDPAVKQALDTYVQKWGGILEAELREEQRRIAERLAAWSKARLASEGFMISDVTAKTHGAFFGSTVVRLMRPGQELPFHKFTSGDLVTLCRRDPLTEKCWEGVVLDRSRWEVRIVVDEVPRQLTQGVWRMDVGANMAMYLRCAAALRALYRRPGAAAAGGAESDGASSDEEDAGSSRGAQDAPVYRDGGRHPRGRGRGRGRGGRRGKRQKPSEEEEEMKLPPGTVLSPLLVGFQNQAVSGTVVSAVGPSGVLPQTAVAWAASRAQAVGKPDAQRTVSVAGQGQASAGGVAQGDVSDVADILVDRAVARTEDAELGLNASQTAAVTLAMQNRVSVIQGPPGTGKTSTIVRFLALLTRQLGYSDQAILVCAQSNVAVDNLLEGLTALGVRALRLGQPAKVRAHLRDTTVDSRVLSHPLQRELAETTRDLKEHMQRLRTLSGRDLGLGHRDAAIKKKYINSLRTQITQEVLRDAQVVCATCVGSGSDMLEGMAFPLVVLDEGSQASELECLIPLTKGAQHVVLVGDHHQLPPTVNSAEALAGGMAVSLMERWLHQGVPSALLQVQYRMHPALSQFPSARYYAGRLVDGVAASDRPAPPGLPWPSPTAPLMFVDVQGVETVSQSGSKANRAEAELCGQLLAGLLRAGVRPGDIGLVTPYAAQAQLLADQVQHVLHLATPDARQQQRHGGDPPGGTLDDSLSNLGPPEPELEVRTVDGYQGREKEVIILSAVRSNSENQVGFLADWRRLNVAITRARSGLIIVGHAGTLKAGDPHWAALVSHCSQLGCMVTPGPLTKAMTAATTPSQR